MANINVLIPAPTTEEARILQRVIGRKDLSKGRFAGQLDLFRELNRAYYSLPPRVPGRTPDQDRPATEEDSEPNIIVPVFFSVIEQMLPVWMFQMFGTGSFGLDVVGRTEEDHKNAENIELQLEYQFQQAKVFRNSIPIGKQLFKFGTGIFFCGYLYDSYELEEVWSRTVAAGLNDDGTIIEEQVKEKTSRRVIRYDGPTLEHVSVTNAFPDPLYGEIEEMRYFIRRRYTDRMQLRKKAEQVEKLTGKSKYKNLDKIADTPRRTMDDLLYGNGPEQEVAEALGWSSRRVRNYNNYVKLNRGRSIDKDNQIIEVTEYWSVDEEKGGDRCVEVANGETVILDQPIPWADKDLPFGAVRCFPIEGEFWGYGLGHPSLPLCEAVSGWRNMMMQNAIYNALRTWGVAEEMGFLGPKASVFRPGDVTQIPFSPNGKPLVVDLFQGAALPREAYEYEDRMVSDIQRAVGSSAMIEPSADTATEANYQRQGVVMKDRLIGAITEDDYLTKIAKFFISRSQQFFDPGRAVRVMGKDKVTFKRLTPQDIAGEFDFIARGSQLNPAKAVSREQMLQGLGVAGANPALLGIVDWYEAYLELLKTFEGIRNPERLLNKPTDKVWSPEIENQALAAGIEIDVDPAELHDKHFAAHSQGKMLMIQEGRDSPDAVAAYDAHLAKHQRFMELAGGMTPPQEGTGPNAPMGPGMVPGFGNIAPTEGALAARGGGFNGPGGGVGAM